MHTADRGRGNCVGAGAMWPVSREGGRLFVCLRFALRKTEARHFDCRDCTAGVVRTHKARSGDGEVSAFLA